MAPRHEYDLRVTAFTHSYEVSDNVKPFRARLESDELIVPHEKGAVTLEKLHDLVFVDDEGDDEDPEYVESSGESEDSLEYGSENETPCREYDLRAPLITTYNMDDLKPVTVKLEWEQLIVPHEEGAVTLDKLKDFVFEDEDVDEDPEYEESIVDSEDSLEYESENETPFHEYGLRAPTITSFYDMDELTPVTVELEGGQLIVPREEGSVTLDKLEGFVFEEEDVEDDPDYEESIVDSEDSLEYESDEFEVEEDDEYASQDALASVVTRSCLNLVENEDINWSFTNKAEEYVASFGVSQLGIRLVDSGLAVLETPITLFSTWMSDGVRHTRRHLRAARRAGEKQSGDSCKARSLLVQMATLFPLSTVLDSLGVGLVEATLHESYVDENIEDPTYVLSSDETEDSLEFRSEIESEEDLVSDVESESISSSSGWEDETDDSSEDYEEVASSE